MANRADKTGGTRLTDPTDPTEPTEPAEPADSAGLSELEACRERIEQLEQADHRKNLFLGKLAHEIGNLTLPVQLAVEIISYPDIDRTSLERVREILSLQMPQIQLWLDVLRSVSRLSRVLEVRRDPVEVAGAVHRAVLAVQTAMPSAAGRTGDLQSVQPAEQPAERLAVRADPDYLQTILVELLGNAVRYTAPGDAIRVTADRVTAHDTAQGAAGEAVRITVADEGPGIDPEFLPRVFEPLVRGDGQWDWPGGHVGVRLAVARRLAETMGGSLTAHSEGPGRGSRFVLTLPAAEVAETKAESGKRKAED